MNVCLGKWEMYYFEVVPCHYFADIVGQLLYIWYKGCPGVFCLVATWVFPQWFCFRSYPFSWKSFWAEPICFWAGFVQDVYPVYGCGEARWRCEVAFRYWLVFARHKYTVWLKIHFHCCRCRCQGMATVLPLLASLWTECSDECRLVGIEHLAYADYVARWSCTETKSWVLKQLYLVPVHDAFWSMLYFAIWILGKRAGHVLAEQLVHGFVEWTRVKCDTTWKSDHGVLHAVSKLIICMGSLFIVSVALDQAQPLLHS